MACYHPIAAYQAKTGDPVKIGPPLGTANLALPCGKCIGCRTDKATEWAHRCEHEASLVPNNSFLTLTYDDNHLPENGHLGAYDRDGEWQPDRHLQLFIKKVRKHAKSKKMGPNMGSDRSRNIRYFACGEYGQRTNRPHYHAILFNLEFRDTIRTGENLYESATLAELWEHGKHKIGTVTPAAANYIAQYSLKKIGSGDADPDGVWRPAPFLRMSLRPAIGNEWLKKYHTDLAHGYIISNGGFRHAIPRYYQKRIKEDDPDYYAEIQHRKQQHLIDHPTDSNTPERQQDAEIIHTRRKQIMEQRTL